MSHAINFNKLRVAARQDNCRQIRALVEASADVNARDEHGYTVLMYECCNYDANCAAIRQLVASGADTSLQNAQSWTALDIVCDIMKKLQATADSTHYRRFARIYDVISSTRG